MKRRMAKNTRRGMKKRGITPYLSWVLLLAFTTSLGVFMFTWITGQVDSSVSTLESRSLLAYCEDVSISVEDICQNSQTLNINISNTNVKRVDAVIIRLIDLYDNIEVKERNITISAFDTARLTVLKQGTLRQVDLIPVYDDEKRNICQNNIIKRVGIKQC